jgi:hypothetical protein
MISDLDENALIAARLAGSAAFTLGGSFETTVLPKKANRPRLGGFEVFNAAYLREEPLKLAVSLEVKNLFGEVATALQGPSVAGFSMVSLNRDWPLGLGRGLKVNRSLLPMGWLCFQQDCFALLL